MKCGFLETFSLVGGDGIRKNNLPGYVILHSPLPPRLIPWRNGGVRVQVLAWGDVTKTVGVHTERVTPQKHQPSLRVFLLNFYFNSSSALGQFALLRYSMQVPLIRLQCGVNSYDWGKVGKSSAAATFAAATNDFVIQEDKPYAEVSQVFL